MLGANVVRIYVPTQVSYDYLLADERDYVGVAKTLITT